MCCASYNVYEKYGQSCLVEVHQCESNFCSEKNIKSKGVGTSTVPTVYVSVTMVTATGQN